MAIQDGDITVIQKKELGIASKIYPTLLKTVTIIVPRSNGVKNDFLASYLS